MKNVYNNVENNKWLIFFLTTKNWTIYNEYYKENCQILLHFYTIEILLISLVRFRGYFNDIFKIFFLYYYILYEHINCEVEYVQYY